MKVLFVLGGKVSALHKENNKNEISFFINEQAEELQKLGIKVDYFKFNLNSKFDIFKRIVELRKLVTEKDYDLIHAHYGLFGFASLFSKKHTPILTTFHGSDINSKVINIFSTIAIKYSTHSIFVSQSLYDKAWLRPKKNYSIIPCGVSGDIFVPMDKFKARKILGFKKDTNYILFPSRISNPVKNYPLAKKALDLLDFKFELIELMKKTREEVNLIMNACDLLILTSKSEGSPQVIKEALFTNLPIVSVDVGDVSENIKNVTNCFVASNNPKDLSIKIKKIISNKNRTNGSSVVNKFYNNEIAEEIKGIYNSILKIDEVKK